MRRNAILNLVATDKQYKEICYQIAGTSHLGDDLYQEVVLALCEYPNFELEKVYSRHRQKRFPFFFIRIATNMFRNPYSEFNKKYTGNRKQMPLYDESIPIPDDTADRKAKNQFEQIYALVLEEIEAIEKKYHGRYPYDVRLLQCYAACGNLRELEKQTGIPYNSAQQTIAKVKFRIANHVNANKHTIDS